MYTILMQCGAVFLYIDKLSKRNKHCCNMFTEIFSSGLCTSFICTVQTVLLRCLNQPQVNQVKLGLIQYQLVLFRMNIAFTSWIHDVQQWNWLINRQKPVFEWSQTSRETGVTTVLYCCWGSFLVWAQVPIKQWCIIYWFLLLLSTRVFRPVVFLYVI